MMPIARSSVRYPDAPKKPTIEEKLESIFASQKKYGYEVAYLMPYASRPQENKELEMEDFSTDELATIRKWLDSYEGGKFREVKIVTNERIFRKKEFLDSLATRGKLVDVYTFEAAPEKFYSDVGNRQEMLQTFIDDPRLNRKDIIFQIPISPWDYPKEKDATNYQIVRHFIVVLGAKYGYEFLRDDRVKFLITTYHPTIPFYPELSDDKGEYKNTITGIILSLIEQEALLTGLAKNADGSQRKPNRADAYNYSRVTSAR